MRCARRYGRPPASATELRTNRSKKPPDSRTTCGPSVARTSTTTIRGPINHRLITKRETTPIVLFARRRFRSERSLYFTTGCILSGPYRIVNSNNLLFRLIWPNVFLCWLARTRSPVGYVTRFMCRADCTYTYTLRRPLLVWTDATCRMIAVNYHTDTRSVVTSTYRPSRADVRATIQLSARYRRVYRTASGRTTVNDGENTNQPIGYQLDYQSKIK